MIRNILKPYMQRNKMEEIIYELDLQMNEAFNTIIMRYAPKGGDYWSTLSLTNIILVAVEVHYVVNKHFWCDIHKDLGITITISLKTYCTTKDPHRHLKSIQK